MEHTTGAFQLSCVSITRRCWLKHWLQGPPLNVMIHGIWSGCCEFVFLTSSNLMWMLQPGNCPLRTTGELITLLVSELWGQAPFLAQDSKVCSQKMTVSEWRKEPRLRADKWHAQVDFSLSFFKAWPKGLLLKEVEVTREIYHCKCEGYHIIVDN